MNLAHVEVFGCHGTARLAMFPYWMRFQPKGYRLEL
jgi:hypothetical protein